MRSQYRCVKGRAMCSKARSSRRENLKDGGMAEEGLQRVGGKLAGLPKTLGTHDVAIGVCSGAGVCHRGEHLLSAFEK